MTLDIRSLHPLFAAEAGGVDLAQDLDAATVQAISDAIDRYAVLVFRGQRLDNDQQVALARRFGEPEVSIQAFRKGETLRVRPEIADVSNIGSDGKVRGRDDRHRMSSLGNQLWHTDSSFRRVTGALSMLHAHGTPPPEGGETEFTDLRAVYDALPDAMRRKVDGLVAEHSIMHSRGLLGFTDFSTEEHAAMPPVPQPVVRRHAGSGRRSLYLASHASHIVGWPVPDGRMLLRDLIEFATQGRFVHRHHWQAGDLVVWDNRCTMHRGRSYDETLPRDLRRVTTSDTGSAMAAGLHQVA